LKFAFNNFPKSDLSIYIDVSFDIAYMRRKSQLGKKVKDEKFYKNKNKIYSKLVNGNNSIITVSNNSKLVHDSVKVIKDHINKKILLD
jgi:thymidylate kinase